MSQEAEGGEQRGTGSATPKEGISLWEQSDLGLQAGDRVHLGTRVTDWMPAPGTGSWTVLVRVLHPR